MAFTIREVSPAGAAEVIGLDCRAATSAEDMATLREAFRKVPDFAGMTVSLGGVLLVVAAFAEALVSSPIFASTAAKSLVSGSSPSAAKPGA